MEATVYKANSDVYYRVTVDATATCKRFKYAISHGGDVLSRYNATDDLVDELHTAALL